MNLISRTLSRAAVKAVDKELHKPQKGDGKTVHLPKLLLIIGIIGTLVFLIPSVYAFFGWKTVGGGIAFLAMSLFCSTLITAYVNQRIYYDDEGFTAKSFFGIKRRYAYSDIDFICGDVKHDSKIIAKGRKIHLDEIAIGKIEFIAFARKRYSMLNNGRKIPRKQKTSRFDFIFKGNVRNAGAHVFLYVFILTIWLGMFLLMFVTNVPTEMEDLTLKTVTVEGYATDDEYLYLNIDGFDDDIFLRGYNEILDDTNEFINILKKREPIEIGYETNVDDGETYHRIEYVKDKNGNVLTTPEDYHEFYQRDVKKIAILFASIILLWVAYVLFVIYVGRNPHKFSPKFVYKFYKEDDIRM